MKIRSDQASFDAPKFYEGMTNKMKKVISKDGTPIAFDQLGTGPALILVGGALSVRSHPVVIQLAERLAADFSVFNYDRRGRGDSGDTPPYAVKREVEDIEALIDEAGGSAFIYGHSSGAVLALEAASRLPARVKKLALYEPPFILNDSRPPAPADYVAQINQAIAAGRRAEAVTIFMTKVVGIPEEYVAPMREDPSWAGMEAVAHTIAYDGTIMDGIMSGKPLPNEKKQQWASATMPTLVMAGGNSEAFFHDGAQTLVDILPRAQYRVLEGQDHAVSPEIFAPVLVEFFKG
jgi:pimeloyl-ACP methyl ester carboxylesterase